MECGVKGRRRTKGRVRNTPSLRAKDVVLFEVLQ